MADTVHSLIEMLADGNFHSGETLGRQLGVGRAAVWKVLQQLPALGLELHAVTGRGYRLAQPIELLQHDHIVSLLDESTRNTLSELHLFHSIDSTSTYLKKAAETGVPSATVCAAEYQSDGRGRRGRHWHSPYGSNIYLSILWRFDEGMSRLGALSLAVAVATMRSLSALGASGLGIKWPNDIVGEKGKLAGILVDVAGESSGPCHAVIGIGVNYAMNKDVDNCIDQEWTQLRDCNVVTGRNEIIAMLLQHLFAVLALYEQEGMSPFYQEWSKWDVLRDKEVLLHMTKETREGIARGIDESGLLLVEEQGSLNHYAAGEVSLRRVEQ